MNKVTPTTLLLVCVSLIVSTVMVQVKIYNPGMNEAILWGNSAEQVNRESIEEYRRNNPNF